MFFEARSILIVICVSESNMIVAQGSQKKDVSQTEKFHQSRRNNPKILINVFFIPVLLRQLPELTNLRYWRLAAKTRIVSFNFLNDNNILI